MKKRDRMTRVYVPAPVSSFVTSAVRYVAIETGCEIFEIYGAQSGCRLPVAARNIVVDVFRQCLSVRTPPRGRGGCPKSWNISPKGPPPNGFIPVPYCIIAKLLGIRHERSLHDARYHCVKLADHDRIVSSVIPAAMLMGGLKGVHVLDDESLKRRRQPDRDYRAYRRKIKEQKEREKQGPF